MQFYICLIQFIKKSVRHNNTTVFVFLLSIYLISQNLYNQLFIISTTKCGPNDPQLITLTPNAVSIKWLVKLFSFYFVLVVKTFHQKTNENLIKFYLQIDVYLQLVHSHLYYKYTNVIMSTKFTQFSLHKTVNGNFQLH